MTDNEIIKALECCGKQMACKGCPLAISYSAECLKNLHLNALNLIHRQKAEIINAQADKKSEAIKEFAERLNARMLKDIDEQGMFPLPYTKKAYDTVRVFINNLVKEMTEEKK